MTQDPKMNTLILETLERCPNYGYRIAQDILARAPKLLEGQESALYPELYQLELDGILQSYEQLDGETTRRYYRLTEKGQGKLINGYEKESDYILGSELSLNGSKI